MPLQPLTHRERPLGIGQLTLRGQICVEGQSGHVVDVVVECHTAAHCRWGTHWAEDSGPLGGSRGRPVEPDVQVAAWKIKDNIVNCE